MKSFQLNFWRWLPFALLATLMAGLVYIAVQQDLRQTANDPQIELAEDASALLASGQPPEIFGTNAATDMSKSLAPFIIVYDASGKVLNGTASLNDKIPTPPAGVFENAKKLGQNHLTWQPEPGVRIAAIVSYYNGTSTGYVLAGKSLREVEKRENQLMLYVFVAWIIALMSTYAAVAFMPSRIDIENQA